MSSRTGLDLNLLVAMFGEPDAWSGLSASALGATTACPPRLALPGARTTGEAAERGNSLHNFLRLVSVNPTCREEALKEVPEEWRSTAKGINLEAALDGLRIVGCERAYAFDVKSRKVRFIGENIGRDYQGELARRGEPPLSRYEIPFTVDVEFFWNDIPGELDWKSGQSIGEVADHGQRKVCAYGLMVYHDTSTAISRVGYIKEDGSVVPDGHEFSILDLDDFCDECVKTIDAVWEARLLLANGIMPTVYPSDEACAYCSAMTSCPFYTNFAKSMVGRLQAVENGPELSELTPEEQGKVWADAKLAAKLAEGLIDKLKKMADRAPIPVGEKYEVRPEKRSKEYFDAAKARGLIITLLGRSGAEQEEIDRQMSELTGRNEYYEYRKLKRQLPMAS